MGSASAVGGQSCGGAAGTARESIGPPAARVAGTFRSQTETCIGCHTLVVFEGVFLFRPELAPFLDYRVFLEIPLPMAKARAKVRDVPRFGVEILTRYDRKSLPAQQQYRAAFPPAALADMIIDNRDWEHPAMTLKRGAYDNGGKADTPAAHPSHPTYVEEPYGTV